MRKKTRGRPIIVDVAEIIASDTEPGVSLPVFASVSAAESLLLDLSPQQRRAIELITSGHTLVDSATAAGVSRKTLYQWLKGDAAFTAAFNAWQQDAIATARGRLLAMSDLACNTLMRSMQKGDSRTALAVLKSLGILQPTKPGPTDPIDVDRDQRLAAERAEADRQKRENDLRFDQVKNSLGM